MVKRCWQTIQIWLHYQDKSSLAPHTEQTVQENVSCWENILSPPERGEDYTILQATFSIDMVILLLVSICSLGSNMTMVNNLNQIGTSLGYPSDTIITFVSLVSIWMYLGYLYDKEARRQMEAMGQKIIPGEELKCNGDECYKLTFIIMTAACLFGALLSLILVFWTPQFYRSDLYKKFKEANETETVMFYDRIESSGANESLLQM
ncbi:hypothetical protein VNO78_33099 [Psophocarpus tetragonolobus]|uniref:Uncharacterized protein n=1 Tax=Psophocarpus tetragonolobus TaxID=3891 RepID=A0AAN9RL19_PSOTE